MDRSMRCRIKYGIVTLFDALFKGTSDPLPIKKKEREKKRGCPPPSPPPESTLKKQCL